MAAADEGTFLLKMEEAHLQLPCIEVSLEPTLAARYHRDAGLWLYVAGDKAGTTQAFSSARRIEAGHQVPGDMLPSQHPIRALFDTAPASETTVAVPKPDAGDLLFDGSIGARPADSPTIAQLTDPAGGLVFTAYLRPADALPAFPSTPVKQKGGGLLADHPLGVALAAGSGLALVGSGVFMMRARTHLIEFEEGLYEDPDELGELYDINRRSSATSAVLLGAAGALSAGAVFAW